MIERILVGRAVAGPKRDMLVNPAQAILSAFRNYANFEGRACRSEYWWFYLLFVVLLGRNLLGQSAMDADAAVGLGGIHGCHGPGAGVGDGAAAARPRPFGPVGDTGVSALCRRAATDTAPSAARHYRP